MKFGDDGISTVPVHDFYEGLDASGLIDVIADVLVRLHGFLALVLLWLL